MPMMLQTNILSEIYDVIFANMDGLREAVMIITLFMIFCFVIASEVFIYVKPENIYMPLIFCNFFPHMSVPMLPDTKYLLLSYTI